MKTPMDHRGKEYMPFSVLIPTDSREHEALNKLLANARYELDDPSRQWLATLTPADYGMFATAICQRIGSPPRGAIIMDTSEPFCERNGRNVFFFYSGGVSYRLKETKTKTIKLTEAYNTVYKYLDLKRRSICHERGRGEQ